MKEYKVYCDNGRDCEASEQAECVDVYYTAVVWCETESLMLCYCGLMCILPLLCGMRLNSSVDQMRSVKYNIIVKYNMTSERVYGIL